jgi:uncharacterized protein YggU (UPF0235/DUF167 family)
MPCTLDIWAQPGSSQEEVRWDPWRRRWNVRVPALPEKGAANAAILDLLARRLGVPRPSVRWLQAGTSPAKRLTVEGLDEEEARRRLAAEGTRK